MKVLEAIGGRKFVLVVLCVFLAVFAINVDAEAKLKFLEIVLGTYVAGNVAQKFTPQQ